MQVVISFLWKCLCWYLRPFVKWFLHKTTRLCELQRICYGSVGAERSCRIETSLARSRNEDIQNLMKHLYSLAEEGKFHGLHADKLVHCAVSGIVTIKRIKLNLHKQFYDSLASSLHQILGYRQLKYEVEKTRQIPYASEIVAHEEKLLKLWLLLVPEQQLTTRISKQWGMIGFQGDDPKTDFRGMGILGLDNLLHFSSSYNCAARHVLSHSHHPKYGYSFAIVGINLTSMACNLLAQGKLKSHLYNSIGGKAEMDDFHKVYSYLFYEFDKFWLAEKPKDIMEFNRIRDKFYEEIQARLEIPTTMLKINLAIDVI